MPGLTFNEHHDFILREVERQSCGLARRLGLGAIEREDLVQDLLVDLIPRLRFYDPAKASPATFVTMVVSNRAVLVALRYSRERLLSGRCPISLDQEAFDAEGEQCSLGHLVAESHGYGALMGNRIDRFEEVERRLDIGSTLARLPRNLHTVWKVLATTSPTRASQAGHGSRTHLYRQIRELRLRFRMAGLSCPA